MKQENPHIITASNLGAIRGGRSVFSGLGFELSAGCIMLLKGTNGSGKSTLLRLLAGLLPASAGSLHIGGISPAEDPAASQASLHYIGHADALKPVWTLRQNLDFFARTVLGLLPEDSLIEKAAASMDLLALLDQPVRYFSAGQRHRSSLARLGLGNRSLWLLDEPTVGLDAANRALLATMIERHLATGGAVIAATHDALDLAAGTPVQTLLIDDFTVPPPAGMGVPS